MFTNDEKNLEKNRVPFKGLILWWTPYPPLFCVLFLPYVINKISSFTADKEHKRKKLGKIGIINY